MLQPFIPGRAQPARRLCIEFCPTGVLVFVEDQKQPVAEQRLAERSTL